MDTKSWMLSAVAVGFVLGCAGEPMRRYRETPPSRPSVERLEPKQARKLSDSLSSQKKREGWPDKPRLWARLTHAVESDKKFQVGLRVQKFGVDVGGTRNVTFTMGHQTSVIFITTAQKTSQRMTRESEGEVRFNVLEGAPYIAICDYKSFLETKDSLSGHLEFFGSGGSGNKSVRDLLSRRTFSRFMKVDADESPRDYLNDKCRAMFEEKVEDAVKADLKALAKESLTFERKDS